MAHFIATSPARPPVARSIRRPSSCARRRWTARVARTCAIRFPAVAKSRRYRRICHAMPMATAAQAAIIAKPAFAKPASTFASARPTRIAPNLKMATFAMAICTAISRPINARSIRPLSWSARQLTTIFVGITSANPQRGRASWWRSMKVRLATPMAIRAPKAICARLVPAWRAPTPAIANRTPTVQSKTTTTCATANCIANSTSTLAL